ncbi:thioesterase family protein [Brevibacterium sp.]|uniref:acyl-CoA thioesterase n=1 Tax=Brevibacterium sp. TaxID=1701 RepID=UPI0028127D2A|nr:thioesterase family protein [Brevibacterium sp.]
MPEIDNQGYMFNSRYLEIADAALTEFFRAGGFTLAALQTEGFDPSVVETTLRYRAPVRLDELLSVRTVCTRVGTSSFGMSFEIVRDEETVTEIDTAYVNVDARADRSRAIPQALIEFLELMADAAHRT